MKGEAAIFEKLIQNLYSNLDEENFDASTALNKLGQHANVPEAAASSEVIE